MGELAENFVVEILAQGSSIEFVALMDHLY